MAAAIFKNPKSRYLDNGLTNRHEIWQFGAIRHLWCVSQLELCNFKNPTWRPPPFRKIEKIAISRPQFQRFKRNFARWCISALVTVRSVTNLRSKEIQDGGGPHSNNFKITISRQRFDRSAHYLAWWRILALRIRRAIHERSYASVRAQIFTSVTLITKLSYVRKLVNSCVNIRTIWAVERQKVFVKRASWWSYLDVWF